MALTVNTNVASLTAQRNLTGSQSSLSTSLERLSSGLRINSAKDDAAGLAISERFTAQIRGLNQGVRNANDGISLAQTAEGALKEITSNLQRIRELAVQSANATNSASDRTSLQVEVGQLIAEIDRVATTTTFNGIKLLDGSFTSKAFQVGANSGDTVSITSIASASKSALGSSYSASATLTAVSGAGLTASGAGSVGINGVNLGATVTDGVSSDAATGSALAVKNAINAVSDSTGVTATASTVVESSGYAFTALNTKIEFSLNDVYITFNEGADAGASIDAAVAKINEKTPLTGIVAGRDAGDGDITLTAADGRNIEFAEISGAVAALGLTAQTNYGSIELSSTSQYGIQITNQNVAATDTVNGETAPTVATSIAAIGGGFAAQVTASGTTGLTSLSVGTVAEANTAIGSIDAALDSVNSSRATLGAYQNRFESVVANLQTTAENLSASRSRIVDADFASETANLTKAQILQQSGIAMLAQANALPQNVLALLQ